MSDLFHGRGASIIERSQLGCATIDTITEAADSIELKVVTGHNDKGYCIKLADNEYLVLEARAMRPDGRVVANDGMYIFWVKDSIFDTEDSIYFSVWDYLISDYSDIYEREYIPFGAHSYPDTTFFWLDTIDYVWHYHYPYMGSNSFTTQSYVDNVWITNIRWKNDSVMLFDFNSDIPHVEIEALGQYGASSVGGKKQQAKIISYTGNIVSKGIIYSRSEAECNMEQGTVVYDTSASTSAISTRLDGLEKGVTYCYRAFASNGTHTSFSAVKQFKDEYVTLRHAYYDSGSDKFLLDMELSEDVSYCYYQKNIIKLNYILGTHEFPYLYDTLFHEWDVIDTTGTLLEECQIDTTENTATFGLWVFTSAGDTLNYMFEFDFADIDTIQIQHPYLNTSATVVNDTVNFVGQLSWTDQQGGRCWIGTVPKSPMYSAFTYYTDDIICNEYSDRCDTAAQFRSHLNSSFANYMLTHYTFTEVDDTNEIAMPILHPDSAFVTIGIDRYGAARVTEWDVTVGMKADQAIGEAFLTYNDYEEVYFTTDSTLLIELYPSQYDNHYYMLEGTASELMALDVTDTATAIAYFLAHQAEMIRHDCPWLLSGGNGIKPIEQSLVRTVMPNSDYYIYLFPFNAAGTRGRVSRLLYHITDRFADVTPGGNGDTAWWYAENGVIIGAWKYSRNAYLRDYHMYLAPLGCVDSLCAAGNVDYVNLLPSLMQAGLTRDYGNDLPYANHGYYPHYYSDTAMHLLPDTTYELCLWASDNDGKVYFQRTPINTYGAPKFGSAALKELYYRGTRADAGDTVFYCFIDADDATAYYHVIIGEEGALATQGIASLSSAGQYSLTHSSTLEKYTHQTTEIRFKAGTDGIGSSYAIYLVDDGDGFYYYRARSCWQKYIDWTMSNDSVYRIYVIPYDADDNQGIGRYIRFSPLYGRPDSAVYGVVTECSVSDITENSATLHGRLQVGSQSISVVGFSYRRYDAPAGTPMTTVTVGPMIDETISYRLNGLQPNTTYEYVVAAGYDTDTSADGGYLYDYRRTFTTASCTVDASIDTTICYNAYYGNTRYTSSRTLEFSYLAANGCDSLLTVNLTVLPQRIGYDTLVLCYGEEYNGSARYSSITLTETIHEEDLCDSTHKLHLKVLPKITTTVTDTIHGESYEWDDELITEPGRYTHVITAANGCDSTIVLTLLPESHEGIDDVQGIAAHIEIEGNLIIVTGAEGQMVTIYDATGRMLSTRRDGIRFEVPSTGTYIVQVSSYPAQRIVVVH